MDQKGTRQPLTSEARLAAYLEAIVGVLGHASRAASAQAYCTGLLLPGERKSIEPMAARLDPTHVQAKHQSLHTWWAGGWGRCGGAGGGTGAGAAGDRAVWAGALLDCRRHQFPKQGTHSVGVARQYCGQLGKQDNCQVAVSLSVATITPACRSPTSCSAAVWANDPARRASRGVRRRSL